MENHISSFMRKREAARARANALFTEQTGCSGRAETDLWWSDTVSAERARRASATGAAPMPPAAAKAPMRIRAILGSPEAKHCPSLADRLAFKTTMSADQAIAAMRTVPVDADALWAEIAARRNTLGATRVIRPF